MKEILALYLRVSSEDKGKALENDSDSIANQRKLLNDFIKSKPDLAQYEITEFSDDGYSGTNFERPGVKRMLALVKEKKIGCIIVKDFSRFGRNYIIVGRYLEEIFPFLGVRFISVNDRFDSKFDDAVGALDIGFKNIMHDYYAKMTSIKIAQMRRFRAEQGTLKILEFYGYIRDKSGKIVRNPEATKTVRQIFAWRMEGLNGPEIARRLNDAGVPAPHPGKTVYSQCWRANNVYHILHNEKYTGKYIFGQTKSVNYKSVPADESEWIIFENAFEPIISKEEFELVNPPPSKKKKQAQNIQNHIFNKKIKCGGCGATMYRNANGAYFCKTARVTEETGCPKMRFDEIKIAAIILNLLNKYIEIFGSAENTVVRKNAEKNDVKKIQGEIKRINVLVRELYEEYMNGKISKHEHMLRREEIGQKKENLERQLAEFEQLKKEKQKKQTIADKLKSKATEGIIQELTPELVTEFVNKVTIYDADHIEVSWNFADMFLDAEKIT